MRIILSKNLDLLEVLSCIIYHYIKAGTGGGGG